MTILTRPSIIVNKPDVTKSPLVDENVCDEEKIEVHPPSEWSPSTKHSSVALMCTALTVIVVTITGIASGLMLYRLYLKSNAVHRYQGFCSIPIDTKELQENQLIEPNYRVLPLRWSADPDVQVFSTAGEGATDDFVNALREEFDIGDTVEKISVLDNGRRINFIHDFTMNTTGIVDEERCFLMDLDPELVMSPEMFVLSVEQGGKFDVSRVRSTLRAVLPALRQLARAARQLADACADRPTYALRREEDLVIRKRSVETPAPDYRQFSGKHVQEIEIHNLAELIEYEKTYKGV